MVRTQPLELPATENTFIIFQWLGLSWTGISAFGTAHNPFFSNLNKCISLRYHTLWVTMPIRSTDDQIKELKDLLGAISGLQVRTKHTTSIHIGWMDH